jgi:hypothetical protein
MKNFAPITAVLVAGACTTAMNWRFSFQLGANPFDSYTLAIFSVALDVSKWFMLPCAALAWNGHRLRAVAAIAIWLVATTYSFTAAIGFAALNRAASSGNNQTNVELLERLETMRQSPRWISSAACADATVPRSHEFCETYRALAAQVNSATREADPQSTLLAQLTGFEPQSVRLILSLFLALACEIISALGLFALMTTQPTQSRPIKKPWARPPRPDDRAPRQAQSWLTAPERDAPRPAATWKSPR